MELKRKKSISLFPLFSLVLLSTNRCQTMRSSGSVQNAHGAKLLIMKKDGLKIRGELIQVKQSSLLLQENTGKDTAVDIAEIREIQIIRKSESVVVILAELFFLYSVGASVRYLVTGGNDDWNARKKAAALGSAAGVSLGIIWAIAAASKTTNTQILLEGLTDTQISDTLENLRQIARIH